MFGYFLVRCKNHCFLSKTGDATFWATVVKTWATFYFNIWSHWQSPRSSGRFNRSNNKFDLIFLTKIFSQKW